MATDGSVSEPRERFEAAVEVIQSLPKKGSFQPSHEMMLRFYSLFKQANLGQCTGDRPSFWDPVGRAKWDSWNSLGSMSSEEAMDSYVEELKKIIEVMPQTEVVGNFTRTLGRFYELVDLEKPAALVHAVREVSSNQSFSDKSPTPSRTPLPNGHVTAPAALDSSADRDNLISDELSEDDDNDEFADTFDSQPVSQSTVLSHMSAQQHYSGIVAAVDRLQTEMSSVATRLSAIEQSVGELVAFTRPQVRREMSVLAIFRALRMPRSIRSIILFIIPLIAGYLLARRFVILRRR